MDQKRKVTKRQILTQLGEMSKGYEQGIENMYKYKYIHTLSRWKNVSSLLELQIKII